MKSLAPGWLAWGAKAFWSLPSGSWPIKTRDALEISISTLSILALRLPFPLDDYARRYLVAGWAAREGLHRSTSVLLPRSSPNCIPVFVLPRWRIHCVGFQPASCTTMQSWAAARNRVAFRFGKSSPKLAWERPGRISSEGAAIPIRSCAGRMARLLALHKINSAPPCADPKLENEIKSPALQKLMDGAAKNQNRSMPARTGPPGNSKPLQGRAIRPRLLHLGSHG